MNPWWVDADGAPSAAIKVKFTDEQLRGLADLPDVYECDRIYTDDGEFFAVFYLRDDE